MLKVNPINTKSWQSLLFSMTHDLDFLKQKDEAKKFDFLKQALFGWTKSENRFSQKINE